MAKKKDTSGYLSAKESRRISKQNRKITDEFEKKYKRKNVPESEYLTEMKDKGNVLEIEDLHTYFFTDVGTAKAVDGVTFEVPQGKTVGVVGESGCGKSVTSLSVMQLLQRPQGQIVSGSIRINLGDKAYEIKDTPIEVMQKLRGNFVSMVFQEPMTSLNPANVAKDDPRVLAAQDWAAKHWTLDENPGQGPEGLYYFYTVLVKCLDAFGDDLVTLPDGTTVAWREAVVRKILSLQYPDGHWVNDNNRWWEADPTLVTSYAILALDRALGE